MDGVPKRKNKTNQFTLNKLNRIKYYQGMIQTIIKIREELLASDFDQLLDRYYLIEVHLQPNDRVSRQVILRKVLFDEDFSIENQESLRDFFVKA